MEMHLANIRFCEKPRKGAQLSFCTMCDINTRQPSWFIPTKMLETSNKVGQRHPSKLSESTMQLEPLERPKPAFQLDLSYTTSVPRRRCSGQKLAPGECRLPMDSLVCKESRPILHHVQVKTHTAVVHERVWTRPIGNTNIHDLGCLSLWMCRNLHLLSLECWLGHPNQGRLTYQQYKNRPKKSQVMWWIHCPNSEL